MAIKIEKAKDEDVSFLAQMILQSSRADKKVGLFDYLFEESDDTVILEKLQKLVIDDAKPYCHRENFLVAEVDGKRVGTLCSYEPRVATKERFIEALQKIGCDASVVERLEKLSPCEFQINNRTLMFDFLEEVAGYIDVGILKALMQKSLLTARLKGYRIAQTVIEIGSLESQMFYEKLGFSQKEQKECDIYKEVFGRTGVMLFSLEF
jgi:hypothetical protein